MGSLSAASASVFSKYIDSSAFSELKRKSKYVGWDYAIATKSCEVNDDKFDPANWWGTFGVTTPHLKKIAMRILSLTTSSSGCEKNWSTFEGIHTKKRNRLQTEKLKNLIYVQFNANLMDKHKREKERKIEVLLASDASEAREWIVDCVDGDEVEPGLPWQAVSDALGTDEVLRPRRSSRLRELSEEEFESDNEEEVDEIEYESYEERILEQYGQDDEQPTNATDV